MWWTELPFASHSHLTSSLNFSNQNCQFSPEHISQISAEIFFFFLSSLFVSETNWHNWMLRTCIFTALLLIKITLARIGQAWQNTREGHREGKTWVCTPWVPWEKPLVILEHGKSEISFLLNLKSLSEYPWETYLDTCMSATSNITISLKQDELIHPVILAVLF